MHELRAVSFAPKFTSKIKRIYATSLAHVQTIKPSALVSNIEVYVHSFCSTFILPSLSYQKIIQFIYTLGIAFAITTIQIYATNQQIHIAFTTELRYKVPRSYQIQYNKCITHLFKFSHLFIWYNSMRYFSKI